MSDKDAHLYGGKRQRNLAGGKEISSSTTLSFTSQLSSLINSSNIPSSKPTSSRSKSKKEDIFSTHNRNTAKRAKRDLEPDDAGTFEQKHTTNGEALDRGIWERSKRKMEEKARLYAAMKRGDLEDADERYAVDFDAKWAESRAQGKEEVSDDDDDDGEAEQIEYVDEFGRTRTGTRLDVLRMKQQAARREEGDPYAARPAAPANVIYGDTIQHEAFDPDEPRAAQMEELAKKRDKSLTPPPDEHFDSHKEVRTKGTGFFQFSGDAEERKQQMENLERERLETEKRRKEREGKMSERKAQIEARRDEIRRKSAKRKADEFLRDLGAQMSAREIVEVEEGEEPETGTDMTNRIEDAIRREEDET
ncbi:hypothetical protein PRZ48_013089 [Zasmidium cellare]|uniref:Uncharacterized protein n=1 Tax=Zasmidium cellare TaxID=395010 RepID=A0ABR0E3M6_ZASCE|nr:hypothetical protein PRZ48_013089 [Zasmidium cellare]